MLLFQIVMNAIKFIEYSRKCDRGDCTCHKKSNFSIELFDAITSQCILENQEEFTYKCFHCKTVNTIDFNKVFNKGIMNLVYQKIMNKNMGIKASMYIYNILRFYVIYVIVFFPTVFNINR